MEKFAEALHQAFHIYPVIALVFTVLYIGWNYHKYGSIRSLRILIVYSFVMYMLCVICLVILPLPTPQEASALSGHARQLDPMRCIYDMKSEVGNLVSKSDISTWIYLLNSKTFLYTIFNVFMTIPFGMYMKYYFDFGFIETFFLSFLLTLVLETSQLTGLFFIFPGSYRMFDVDDIITNTAGGVIGWILGIPLCYILPTREEMDEVSYEHGQRVSLMRRVASFFFDVLLCVIIGAAIWLFFHFAPRIDWLQPYMTQLEHIKQILKGMNIPVLFALYMIFFSLLTDGQTPGQKITSTRATLKNGKRATRTQCAIRSTLFSVIMILIPWYIFQGIQNISTATFTEEVLISIVTGIWLIGCIVMWFRMFLNKPAFYEKASHTRITSTIKVDE